MLDLVEVGFKVDTASIEAAHKKLDNLLKKAKTTKQAISDTNKSKGATTPKAAASDADKEAKATKRATAALELKNKIYKEQIKLMDGSVSQSGALAIATARMSNADRAQVKDIELSIRSRERLNKDLAQSSNALKVAAKATEDLARAQAYNNINTKKADAQVYAYKAALDAQALAMDKIHAKALTANQDFDKLWAANSKADAQVYAYTANLQKQSAVMTKAHTAALALQERYDRMTAANKRATLSFAHGQALQAAKGMETLAKATAKATAAELKRQATAKRSMLNYAHGQALKMAAGMNAVAVSTTRAGVSLENLMFGFKVAVIGRAVTSLVKMADTMALLESRAALVTPTNERVADVMERIVDVSLKTRASLVDTTTLYNRLQPALARYGKTTDDVFGVIETFNSALLVSGATARETSSAILQFSQSMAAGKLAGDEFRSVSEAAPALLDAIAKGSGHARDKLKDMSRNGLLTTKLVADSLIKTLEEMRIKAGGIPVNLQQGFTALKGSFSYLVSVLNNSTNATGTLGNKIYNLALSLKDFASELDKGTYAKAIQDLKTFSAVVTGLTVTFYALKLAQGTANGGLIAYIKTTKIATAATSVFNTVLKANPLIRIASIILGAATALYFLKDATVEVGGEFYTFGTVVSAVVKNIARSYEDTINTIKEKFSTLINFFTSSVPQALGNVTDFMTGFFDRFVGLFVGLTKAGKFVIDNIKSLFKGDFEEVVGGAKAAFTEGFETTYFTKGIETTKEGIKALGDGIKNYVKESLEGIDSIQDKADKMGKRPPADQDLRTDYEKETEKLQKQLALMVKVNDAFVAEQMNLETGAAELATYAEARKKVNEQIAAMTTFLEEQEAVKLNPFSALEDFDFEGVFGDIGNPFSELLKGLSDVNDQAIKYAKLTEAAGEDTKALARIERAKTKDELKNTANMLGATKGFFKEKTLGYKALEKGEKAFRLLEFAMSAKAIALSAAETTAKVAGFIAQGFAAGTAALAASLTLPPPASYAAFAATGALLAGIGIALAGGGGGGSSAPKSNADGPQSLAGAGTVLGDAEQQSKSIANSLELLTDIGDSQLGYASKMVISLRNIEQGMTGFAQIMDLFPNAITGAAIAYRTPDSEGNFNSKNGAPTIEDVLGGVVVADIVDTLSGQMSASTRKSFESMLPLADLYEATVADIVTVAQEGFAVLGKDAELFNSQVLSLEVPMLNVNPQLDGEEQAAYLASYFSSIGDSIITAIDPSILKFQKLGEGALETLTRVVLQMLTLKDAMKALDSLGVAPALLLDVADSLSGLAGGVEAFTENVEAFLDITLNDAEQFSRLGDNVSALFAGLNSSLPTSREGLKSLVSALDLTDPAAQKAFTSITAASGLLGDFFDQLENYASIAYSFDTALGANDGLQPLRDALAGVGHDLTNVQNVAERLGKEGLAGLFEGLTNIQKTALEPFIDDLLDMALAVENVSASIESFAGISSGIENYLKGLKTSADSGSPTERAAESLKQFRELSQKALGGDAEAAKALTSSATSLIGLSKDAFASGSNFQSIYAEIISTLEDVSNLTDAATIEELQYNVLLEQLKQLEALNGGVLGLGESLTVELTTTAKSNIEKLIKYVTDTDGFPQDLKDIALNNVEDLLKTVNYVSGTTLAPDLTSIVLNNIDDLTKLTNFTVGSDLSSDMKAIVFNQIADLNKKTNFVVTGDLSSDNKTIILNEVNDLIKKVNYTVGSALSPDLKALALMDVSTLLKTVEFGVSTELTEDQKLLALTQLSTLHKTVNFELSSDLNANDKVLALMNASNLFKSINFEVTSDINADQKTLALAEFSTLLKEVDYIVGSELTAEQKAIALADASTLYKTLQFDKGYFNPEALALANEGNSTITKFIEASGGSLTANQQAILDALNGTASVSLSGDVLLEADNKMLEGLFWWNSKNLVTSSLGAMVGLLSDISAYTRSNAYSQLETLSRNIYGQGIGDTYSSQQGIASRFSSINDRASNAGLGLERLFPNLQNSTGSLYDSTSVVQSIADLYEQLNVTPSAKGNAFKSGSVTAFANGGAFTNSVVSQATMTPMALFGEAGPEAIMPLSRGSDGTLGVRLMDGGFNVTPIVAELAESNKTLVALVRLQQTANKMIIERLDSVDERLETVETKTRLKDSA